MKQPADPFSGTWKLNVANSRLPWPAPQSMVTVIQSNPEAITVREETVNANGEKSTVILMARFDGNDYPVEGSPIADAIAYERPGPRTITGTIKRQGQPIVLETVVVAEDGKSFRGDYVIRGPGGQDITGFAIHERCDAGT